MTTIYDAVDVAAIPANAQTILAYIDGRYQTYNAVKARFPNARVLTITTDGLHKADICDVESQDATPAVAARGVKNKLYRTVYSDRSTKASLDAALAQEKWDWYAAAPGSPAQVIAGSVATQYSWPGYGSPGNYDISVCLDSWLNGLTPTPTPTPTPTGGKMPDPKLYPGLYIRWCYRFLLYRAVDKDGYANDSAFLANGGNPEQLYINIQDSPEGLACIAGQRKSLGF